jgi:protein tyrosine/serine phosphatase
LGLSPRRKAGLAIAAVALGGSAVALLWHQQCRLPKRFGVVVEGQLYRSGEVTPRELEHAARRYGVRTVLSLLDPDAPESVAEREAAARLGLRWVNVPLPGSGASRPEERAEIRQVLFDPEVAPVLVHCAAGANRTGLAVGLYRIHRQGWTVARVLAEMRQYGFEDLPHHQNLREALAAEFESAQAAGQTATQRAQP